MGAWSGEPFGNDTAADWAWELDDSSDWEVVRAALDEVLNAGDYIEVDTASNAIAAAEVVARAMARSAIEQPNDEVADDEAEDDDAGAEVGEDDESVTAFLTRAGDPPPDIVELALAGLDAASGATSELTELWIESGDDEWRTANARIRATLGG